MKVVVNKSFGGFGLSEEAMRLYTERGGASEEDYSMDRTDPILVALVEELGEKVNGRYAQLAIIDLPEDALLWDIADYVGYETIHERHRVWR